MNVVQIVDDFQHNSHTCIVMEYCEQGTLKQKLSAQPSHTFPEKEALAIFRQIVNGVRAIHLDKIIHRNLKLENIMFTNNILKIGGFGLSREMDEDALTYSLYGTQAYTAPTLSSLFCPSLARRPHKASFRRTPWVGPSCFSLLLSRKHLPARTLTPPSSHICPHVPPPLTASGTYPRKWPTATSTTTR